MTVPRVSNATAEVLRYLRTHPDSTDYQLNRHIFDTHGPEAVPEVRADLINFGLADLRTDGKWERWRITAVGERAASPEIEG